METNLEDWIKQEKWLLIRRSRDKLLVVHFLYSGISRARTAKFKHLSLKIPEPNFIAYAVFLLVLIAGRNGIMQTKISVGSRFFPARRH